MNFPMRQKLRVVMLITAMSFCITCMVFAQTVRGRVLCVTSFGALPAFGVPVNLSRPGWMLAAYTDREGFYYFYGVPSGVYILSVPVKNPPIQLQVNVTPAPFVDVPPITIP
jgi:hypothetical protein